MDVDAGLIWNRQKDRLDAQADAAFSDTYNFIKWFSAIDARDLNEQLYDVKDEILTLARAGKAEAIGRLVIAVAEDYADVLARREAGQDVTSDAAAVARRLLAADVAALDAAIARDERDQVLATVEEALL